MGLDNAVMEYSVEKEEGSMSRLEEIKRNEAQRILGKESVTVEEIEKVFESYGEEDLFYEYLVNSAVLTCDQSTNEPQDIKVRDKVLDFSVMDNGIRADAPVDKDKVLGNLIVTQTKRAEIGSEKHATTVDYCVERNIPSFGNCKNIKYNDSEKEKMLEGATKDKIHGNCKYLIQIVNEWEDEDLQKSPLKFDTRAGMKNGLTMTSTLFCAHGGWVYPVTSGQSDFGVGGIDGYIMSCLGAYINGELSEEKVDKIIKIWASCQPPIAQITNWDHVGEDGKYDAYIMAWTYYWNRIIEDRLFDDTKFTIRPEVVKAMIMDESTWGNTSGKNGERDVMQSLYPGDYALWMFSGYDPMDKEKGRCHDGKDEKVIYAIDKTADEGYVEPTMYVHDKFNMDDVKKAKLEGGLGVVKDNIITVITSPCDESLPTDVQKAEGEYLLYYDRVTPNLSIACGIRHLAYKTKEGGSEAEGVRGYNGQGKESVTGEDDAYFNAINEHLEKHLILNGKAMERLKE